MFLAVLSGLLLKVYDDFVDDDPILTNEYVVTSLRTLQVACTAIVLANDFWVCLVFALFNGLCALSSFAEYSRPHVVSYAVLTPVLIALSWTRWTPIGALDWAVLLSLLGTAVIEPQVFPEETSWFKCASRIWGGMAMLTTVLCFPQLNPSMRTSLLMFAGYSVASSMAQMLKLTGLIRASIPAPA